MRTSVLHGVGDVRLESRPIPLIGSDDVLVKIMAVGVCGSDIHYYEHGRIGDIVVESPLVLGHEAGGVVVDVGAAVTTVSPGQRVSLEPGIPCRACVQCLTGHYNLCPRMRFFATPPVDGAFAQYVALPAVFAHPVPDALSDDAAALIEPLSVGMWASRRTAVRPGVSVLVTGAGPIGLLCALVARASGARRIAISDVSPERLANARALGLDAHHGGDLAEHTAGQSFDVLMECSGNARATTGAIDLLAPAGTAVLIGAGPDTLTLPLPTVQNRELVITGAYRYANTWPAAIELVASGTIDLDRIVTGHFGLDRVSDALQASRADATAIKVIVNPQQ